MEQRRSQRKFVKNVQCSLKLFKVEVCEAFKEQCKACEHYVLGQREKIYYFFYVINFLNIQCKFKFLN